MNIDNSIILITGGTGTFGSAFVKYCLQFPVQEIRVFSRDEKKQYEMSVQYKNYPQVKFYIGDIRDKDSINKAMQNVDYVFHAAAMKQVPTCEQYPIEAFKTNVLGSTNVIDAAIENGVKKIVCLSTDKAVYPISTMGLTKSLMEKIALAKANEQTNTKICITRFCNLIASNGSVVPLFLNQIQHNNPITITNPNMTRFFMSLQEALDLIAYAFMHGHSGEIIVKYCQACTIKNLAESVCVYSNKLNYPIKIIGDRPGEKQHEMLITNEEYQNAQLFDNSYLVINPNTINNNKFEIKSNQMELMTQDKIIQLINTIK